MNNTWRRSRLTALIRIPTTRTTFTFLLESAAWSETARQLAAADKLPRIMSDEVSAEIPRVQVIKAAPYFANAQFSPAETTLSIPDPGEQFPYVRAMWHYARGVAHAARGDVKAAREEAVAISRIRDGTDFTQMTSAGVPAPDMQAAWWMAAYLRRKAIIAAAAFRDAAAIQDGFCHTPSRRTGTPVRQTLGAVLLQAGKPAEAEGMFREALRQHPNSAWALFGLKEAQREQGDAAAAAGSGSSMPSGRATAAELRYRCCSAPM